MAKQNKPIYSTNNKAVIAKQNERIINDFLLQFAYTLSIGVLTIFIYNGMGIYAYGAETYGIMKTIVNILAGVSFALGIFSTVWYKLKNKTGYKVLGIYSFITTAISLIYISDKIVGLLKIDIIDNLYPSIERAIFAVFPLLGIALVAEFAVYFIRYYNVNSKKKK